MAQLLLFGFPMSPFVVKVARALAWKKLDWKLVEPRTPLDMRRWNPETGKMPVLEISGERIFDSTFILRRLDAIEPEPALFARAPAAASAQRLLEDWSDESLYWYLMASRWCDANAAATARQMQEVAPRLLRPLARIAFRRQFRGMTHAQGLGRLPHDVLTLEWGRRLDELVVAKGDRDFFHADEPSAADFAIFGQLETACSGPTPEVAELLLHRPALLDWRKRVRERTGG